MVKETIHYSCGHTGIKNITGNTAYRESQIKFYERGVCPECFKAQKNKINKSLSNEYELPKLNGSEKQIAWAESIRVEQYQQIKNNLNRHYTQLSNAIKDKPNYQSSFNDIILNKSINNNLFEFFKSKTSAKYWIENRGSITSALNELYPKINNDVQIFIDSIKSQSKNKINKSTKKSIKRHSKLSTTKRLIAEGKIKTGFVRRLGIKRQTKSGVENNSDKKRLAMLPGYRISKSGKLYRETRQNRSDTPKQRKEVNAYLERKKTRTQKRIPVSKRVDKYKPKYIRVKKTKK